MLERGLPSCAVAKDNLTDYQVKQIHAGPKFSKQWSLFGRFSLNVSGLSRNWRKIVKNVCFSIKIHHKCGYGGKFLVIRRGSGLSENRAADLRPSAIHVPPPPRDRFILSTLSWTKLVRKIKIAVSSGKVLYERNQETLHKRPVRYVL